MTESSEQLLRVREQVERLTQEKAVLLYNIRRLQVNLSKLHDRCKMLRSGEARSITKRSAESKPATESHPGESTAGSNPTESTGLHPEMSRGTYASIKAIHATVRRNEAQARETIEHERAVVREAARKRQKLQP